MLELEVYDRGNKVVLGFEHSLLALSKWEAKNKIPFLTKREKSNEEMLDYYRAMLSPGQDPDFVYRLDPKQTDALLAYINDPMSAGIAPEAPDGKKSSEVQTSDTIYMQMVLLRIPFEAQTWHLNRLMMLIAKTAHAQQPPKKEKPATLLSRWQEINRANRERFNSKG